MPADGTLAACSHTQDFGTSRFKGGYSKSSWFHPHAVSPIGGAPSSRSASGQNAFHI